MSDSSSSSIVSLSASSLLGVAFVVLKLCGVITWSWWWVTAPFWAPAMILVVILAFVLVALACILVAVKILDRAAK